MASKGYIYHTIDLSYRQEAIYGHKKPIIEYLKEDCRRFWDNPNPRRIGSIPLCTDLRDFIRSNSLEVTLRILKNKY